MSLRFKNENEIWEIRDRVKIIATCTARILNDVALSLAIWIGCVPKKCGRVVMDSIVDSWETDKILDLAKKGFAKGGGNGGASILDLHSGAFSKVSFYNYHKLSR